MLAQNMIHHMFGHHMLGHHMFGVVGWHHTTLLHLILSVMCTVILQMELTRCKECSLPQWGGRTSVEFGLGLPAKHAKKKKTCCMLSIVL